MIVSAEILRELLDYNPDTGNFIWKERTEKHGSGRAIRSWNARYAGRPAFVHFDYGNYLRASIFGRFHSAHRVAWAIINGDPVPDFLDHIDGDRRNNRIHNLRPVSKAENSRNRGLRSDNTSGRSGIYVTKSGTFKARIFANGRDQHLGTFKEFEEAAAARKQAEERFGFFEGHGERQGTAWKAGAA
jgi:hypothetical protein